MKNNALILIVLILAVFLMWFAPLWWRGISISHEDQMCYLNEVAEKKELKGEIRSVTPSQSDGGAINLILEDESFYSFPAWMFSPSSHRIHPGDSIVKVKGDLFMMIYGVGKTIRVDMDHGCTR